MPTSLFEINWILLPLPSELDFIKAIVDHDYVVLIFCSTGINVNLAVLQFNITCHNVTSQQALMLI